MRSVAASASSSREAPTFNWFQNPDAGTPEQKAVELLLILRTGEPFNSYAMREVSFLFTGKSYCRICA